MFKERVAPNAFVRIEGKDREGSYLAIVREKFLPAFKDKHAEWGPPLLVKHLTDHSPSHLVEKIDVSFTSPEGKSFQWSIAKKFMPEASEFYKLYVAFYSGVNVVLPLAYKEYRGRKHRHQTYIFTLWRDGDNPFHSFDFRRMDAFQRYEVAKRLSKGLANLHRSDPTIGKAAIVHRDLHSMNVLFNQRSGRVTFLDFEFSEIMQGEMSLAQRGADLGEIVLNAARDGLLTNKDELHNFLRIYSEESTNLSDKQLSGEQPISVAPTFPSALTNYVTSLFEAGLRSVERENKQENKESSG
jgi:serine/threonine protein kinase